MDDIIVAVIDDDEQARESLQWLLDSVKIETRFYNNADTYLQAFDELGLHILILDVRLPGMSGPALHQRLCVEERMVPIIYISGHADIPLVIKAMKAGAADFFTKPFNDAEILDAIQRAQSSALKQADVNQHRQVSQSRYNSLSPTEKTVLRGILACKTNKQIAADMQISTKTIEFHRANIMKKMSVKSVVGLVQQLVGIEKTSEIPV